MLDSASMDASPKHYDVVILGGAFSGAAAAVLLRRDRPDLSVLVVEKPEAFDAKVGEATTEMSGMFLTRRLALWQHLEREHLRKEGLRYWFQNDKVSTHAEASESGASSAAPCPPSSSGATPSTSTSWRPRWPRGRSWRGRPGCRTSSSASSTIR